MLRFLSRLVSKGRGTAIAGWIVEKKFPFILGYFRSKYKHVIYITGTNGKTTTRSILVNILRSADITIVTNAGGANIMRGIAASLLFDTTLLGTTKSTVAVLEVEEATLPKLVELLPATHLIVTNIARDQLDLYGEVDITKNYIQNAINTMKGVHILLNQDDPQLLSLEGEGDGISCPHIQLKYEPSQSKTFKIKTTLKAILKGANIKIVKNTQSFEFTPKILGEYNVVNYALAIQTALSVGIHEASIIKSVSTLEPVFSRSEELKTLQATHHILLIKNPLGFEAALSSFKSSTVLIGINDNIADGADVSWLWDVNFEQHLRADSIAVSGSRSDDMFLRLAQAIRSQKSSTTLHKIASQDVPKFLVDSQHNTLIFGTYTFVMEVRQSLSVTLSLPPIDSQSY